MVNGRRHVGRGARALSSGRASRRILAGHLPDRVRAPAHSLRGVEANQVEAVVLLGLFSDSQYETVETDISPKGMSSVAKPSSAPNRRASHRPMSS